jgi:hypothetical protein
LQCSQHRHRGQRPKVPVHKPQQHQSASSEPSASDEPAAVATRAGGGPLSAATDPLSRPVRGAWGGPMA